MLSVIALMAGLMMGAVGVATGSTAPVEPSETIPNGPAAPGIELPKCIVRLHGVGGGGQPTAVWGGVADVMPSGNRELGTGGRLWDYDTEEEFADARAIVEEATATCGAIMLDGFSNGAAFAAMLYCHGETFDGRLVRVVIDDPVTDGSVADCAPDPSVGVALYWTGALDEMSVPGTDCSDTEYVCLGDTMLGIDAFAQELGVDPMPSIYTDHQWHWYAPELADWSAPPVNDTTPTSSDPGVSTPGR